MLKRSKLPVIDVFETLPFIRNWDICYAISRHKWPGPNKYKKACNQKSNIALP